MARQFWEYLRRDSPLIVVEDSAFALLCSNVPPLSTAVEVLDKFSDSSMTMYSPAISHAKLYHMRNSLLHIIPDPSALEPTVATLYCNPPAFSPC